MKLLTSHFVSTWSLLDDVKRLSRNQYITLELKKQAELAVESYRFPVECMIAMPNGTVIHRMNANELLENDNADTSAVDGLSDGLSANYYKFLNEAISKAKPYFDS